MSLKIPQNQIGTTYDRLIKMLQSVVFIQNSQLPQKTKDDAKRYFEKALNFTLQELDPIRINQLVIQEYRKKMVRK